MDARSPRRRGSTLPELLMVMVIIAALLGMCFPAWRYLKRQADIGATESMVSAVASAISTYSRRQWSWTDAAGVQRIGNLWDLDDQAEAPASSPRFHLLDGR